MGREEGCVKEQRGQRWPVAVVAAGENDGEGVDVRMRGLMGSQWGGGKGIHRGGPEEDGEWRGSCEVQRSDGGITLQMRLLPSIWPGLPHPAILHTVHASPIFQTSTQCRMAASKMWGMMMCGPSSQWGRCSQSAVWHLMMHLMMIMIIMISRI